MTLGWRHWSAAFAVALLLHVILIAVQWSRGDEGRERAVVTLDLQSPDNLPKPVPVSLPSSLAFAWQLGAEPDADQPLPDNVPQPKPAKRSNFSATLGGQSLGLEALTQPAVSAAAGQPARTADAAPPQLADPAPPRPPAPQRSQPAESGGVSAGVARSEPTRTQPAEPGPAPPDQVRLVQREPEDEEPEDEDLPEPEPVPAVVPVSEPALTLEPLLTLGEQAAAPDAEPQSRAETPVREATPADTPAAKPAEPPPPAEREQARPEPPDIDLAIEQALSETARARPSDEFPPPNLTPEPVPQRLPPPPRRDAGADIDRALSDTLDQLARAPAPRTSPPVEYRLPTPEFRPDPADRAPRRQAPNRNAEISRALSGVESHFGQREGGVALPPPPPPVAQRPPEDLQARGRSPAPAEPVAQTPQQAPRTVGGRRADTRYDPNGRPGAYSVNANDFFSRIAEHIFESNDRFVGRLPEGARRLVLDVRFTIDRAGRVMRVDLVSSSGNAALDQAAKDVIWRASPMPQMAQDMISETLELTFPVIVAR